MKSPVKYTWADDEHPLTPSQDSLLSVAIAVGGVLVMWGGWHVWKWVEGAPAMNPRPSIRTDISGVPERAGRSFSWKP